MLIFIPFCSLKTSTQNQIRDKFKIQMFGSDPPDLHLIFVQPADDLITFVHRLLVLLLTNLPVQLLFLQGGPNVERLRLQTILHGFLISLLVILSLKYLCFVDRCLNIILAQVTCGVYFQMNSL